MESKNFLTMSNGITYLWSIYSFIRKEIKSNNGIFFSNKNEADKSMLELSNSKFSFTFSLAKNVVGGMQ